MRACQRASQSESDCGQWQVVADMRVGNTYPARPYHTRPAWRARILSALLWSADYSGSALRTGKQQFTYVADIEVWSLKVREVIICA